MGEITVDTFHNKKILKKKPKKICKKFPQKYLETFSLPSSLPSLTCKFPFLCAKKKKSKNFFSKKKNQKMHRGTLCCALRNKTQKNGKEPFQKALRSILDYCGRKPCQSPKKYLICVKKNDIINASNIIHVFLLCTYFENEIWRCGFLYYSVILKKTSSVCIHQIYFYLTPPSLFCLYLNLEHKSTFV